MKFRRSALPVLLAALAALAPSIASANAVRRPAAEKDGATSPCLRANAILEGRFESEPTTSTASGSALITIDTVANTLDYFIEHQGLAGAELAAHIHGMAPPGENAPPLHNLPLGSPKSGSWTYSEDMETSIALGLTYINVHTAAFPAGEIRGQIGPFTACPPTTPTATATPTPTETPTPTPTETPTPSPTPTESPTPSPTPTPRELPPGVSEMQSPFREPGGLFGCSITALTDWNGDGSGDLAAGARGESGSAGISGSGRAYVLNGADGAPILVLEPPAAEGPVQFGHAVAAIPNFNGAGKAGLAVSSPRSADVQSGAGLVFVYDGRTSSPSPVLRSPSPETSGAFGLALAGLEDVNNDGFGDLAVAAPNEDGGATDAGRVYVFDGRTTPPLRVLESPNPGAGGFFGAALAEVPDADGDGLNDLLIGAPNEDGAGVFHSGRAYLFNPATGALIRTFESPKPQDSGLFGSEVAGSRDLDEDNLGDAIIGARWEDEEFTDDGRLHMMSGATGLILRTVVSPFMEASGNLGHSASGLPDLSGDGVPDVLSGAWLEDGGAEDAGRAYVFDGIEGFLLNILQSPFPEALGNFGSDVAAMNDVNGDGRRDLAVAAFKEDAGAGRAYVFRTSLLATPTPTPTPSATPTETATETPTPTPSETETPAPTPSETETPAPTSTPAETETPAETPTPTPSETETPTPTPAETGTPAPTPTPESTESPTPTSSPTPVDTTAISPTPSPTPIPGAPEVLLHILGLRPGAAGLDFNGDGRVDIADALMDLLPPGGAPSN